MNKTGFYEIDFSFIYYVNIFYLLVLLVFLHLSFQDESIY